MKKTTVIFLTILICWNLIGCQQFETSENGTIEYNIYVNKSDIIMDGSDENDSIENFTDSSQLNITPLPESFNDSTAPRSRKFTFQGMELTGNYIYTERHCEKIEINHNEVHTANVKFKLLDNYKIEANGKTAAYWVNRETEKIEFFYLFIDKPTVGSFTIEEGIEKAREYIKSNYGDNTLAEYKVTTAEYLADYEVNNRISVVFTREINGVLISSETLSFSFNLNGEMMSANIINYGMTDDLIEELTPNRLKTAEDNLRSMFSENDRIQEDKYICVDETTGICYLRMVINLNSYYINIF